jgi:hypothetical protein
VWRDHFAEEMAEIDGSLFVLLLDLRYFAGCLYFYSRFFCSSTDQTSTMMTALAGWLPLPVLYIVLTYFFISWYLKNAAIPNLPKGKAYWLSGLGFYLPCFLSFVAWMGSNILDDLGYEFVHGFIVWFFMGFVVCLVNSLCHVLFCFIRLKKQ